MEVRRCTIWRNMVFQLIPSGNVIGVTLAENHVQNKFGETESDEDTESDESDEESDEDTESDSE